jgi:hypothetical protein
MMRRGILVVEHFILDRQGFVWKGGNSGLVD